MSRGCFCGAGGWRKEAEHLTPSLEADKMLQEQQRSRCLPDVSLSHRRFSAEAGGRQEERRNNLIDSASLAQLSADRPCCS